MIVLMHVSIALLSIGYMVVVYLFPSKTKLNISSGLISLTVATGTYLVVKTHSSVLSVCLMGLFYIGGMLAALIAAQHKLAHQKTAKSD